MNNRQKIIRDLNYRITLATEELIGMGERPLIYKTNKMTEEQECITLVSYLDLLVNQGKVLCYSHIPNSTFTRSWPVKARNKRLGVHAGVPDYVIVMPNKTIFIEMKRDKGGVVSKPQKEWIEALNNGCTEAYVCKGAEQAIDLIQGILTFTSND